MMTCGAAILLVYPVDAAQMGSVVAWGEQEMPIVQPGTQFTAIAAGGNHSLALKTDGTVVAWGYNNVGQSIVPDGLIGVIAISAGSDYNLALRSNGTVAAWGDNTYNESTVPNGLSDVTAIAAGSYHSLALKTDGTVVAWGYNNVGQCIVPGGLNGVIAICAGSYHSLALKSDGTLVAWGDNYYGESTVPSGLTGVIAISTGGSHSLALKSNGTVVAWGDNTHGETNVPEGLGSVVAIAAGNYFSMALKSDGTVVAWGYNFFGQSTVPSELNGVIKIAAGGYHSLALKTEGTVAAWGDNSFGESTVLSGLNGVIGVSGAGESYLHLVLKSDGTVVAWGENYSGESSVPNGLNGVSAIAAGWTHSLALKSNGTVVAWGDNAYGESTVPSGLSNVSAITAGDTFSAALKTDGAVAAWGDNTFGESRVPSGLSGVIAISAGLGHMLALKSDGTVVAWGSNTSGESTVPSGLSGVVAISAGTLYSLALKSDGTVVAWGINSYGQCTVPSGLSNVIAISAGYRHSMALKSDGTVVAWGDNTYGQIFVPGGLKNVVAIAAGSVQSVALVATSNSTPKMINVRARQQLDATLVDIYFDVVGIDNPVSVSVVVSTDAGLTFVVPATHFTGDGLGSAVGAGINYHVVWDAGSDLGAGYFPNVAIKLSAGGTATVSSVFPVNLRGLSGGLAFSGKVVDGSTGVGVAGVNVQLGINSATSDAQGAYSFPSVAVGDYSLTAIKTGYINASDAVSIAPGNSLQRVITLWPPNSSSSSVPKIVQISSKYAGFHYFLDGVLFNVNFTATIDWAGHPPGTVQFIAPRKTYTAAAASSSVSQTLAMGSDFGPNGQLRLVAKSSDGTQSASKFADLLVMPNPIPGILGGALWSVNDLGSDFNYSQTTASPQAFINNVGVDPGIIPSGIPLFGGKPMNLGFLPQVSYSANSDSGVMEVEMAWSDADAGELLDEDWKNGNITELSDHLNRFISAGTLSASEVPKAGFGDLSLSLYPVLGGGWKYNATGGGWQWSNAELGVAGDFSIQQTWPFLAGPVPMFAKVKFDLSATAIGQLQTVNPVNINGEFNLSPTLRGSLGVGASEIASVEGWVQGGLNLNLQYPAKPTLEDASVNVQAGATVYFLLFTKEWTLASQSWDIYSAPPQFAHPLEMQPISGPRILGRGYMNYSSTGIMGTKTVKPKLFGSNGGGANPEILMSPAFPFSDPHCSSSGTNCFLVFLEDNTNRSALNRTMAMFSKYDGNMWSAPVALAYDSTADFHPRILAFPDGSAWATWENESTVQPDTATVSNLETNLEVAVAWYNPVSQSWLPALQMTTNNFLDRSPKLAGRAPNNVLLTWIANPANDVNGSSSAPNQIWSSQWNGSQWSVPQLAGTIPYAILKYDLTYDGTNANLVMAVDTVDNSTNANGHELLRLARQNGVWGTSSRLTADQMPDDNPQMAIDRQGNVLLTWLKGSVLMSVVNFNMANGQIGTTNQYSSNLADFKVTTATDGRLAVLWSEPSENDSDLYAMFFDPVFQVWGAPRQLTHDPQAERGTTAVFYGTNEVIAVYNRSMVSATNSADSTLCDLAAAYYTLGEDLAVDTNFIYSVPGNPSPGGVANLHVRVLNLGDKVETNVVVAFYLGAVQPANEVGRTTLTNALPPQGTNDVTFTWAIPATNNSADIFAVADPDEIIPDVSRGNNVGQLKIVKPDAQIQSVSWSAVASNQVAVTIHVVNDGAISNSSFTVSLNKDSAGGTNLFSQTIGGLAPGESRDLAFLWNVTGLPDNLNVFAVLSGPGVSNNFSAASGTSELSISQAPPPWISDWQYLSNGTFQLSVYGNIGHAYTLQASADLMTWTSILNFTCTNAPSYVIDPGAKFFGWRFYRVAVGTLPVAIKLSLNAPVLLTTNGLGLNLQAPLGFSYTIQASTDLLNWQPITNFTGSTSPFYFHDSATTNYSRRFYRAIEQ